MSLKIEFMLNFTGNNVFITQDNWTPWGFGRQLDPNIFVVSVLELSKIGVKA